MSREITIEENYIKDFNKKRNIISHDYFPTKSNDNVYYQTPIYIGKVLSTEIDVFSDLPQYVYKHSEIKLFLDEFKKELTTYNQKRLSSVSLSKLRVTEAKDDMILIEWIFNYFRVYFIFDKKEGNYYGEVSINYDTGDFHNEVKKMKRSDYSKIVRDEIEYVVSMAGGTMNDG